MLVSMRNNCISMMGLCNCNFQLPKIEDNYEIIINMKDEIIINIKDEIKNNVKIVFDWDDTLFPSTWIKNHGYGYDFVMTEKIKQKMDDLGKVVIRILTLAKTLGDVIIVTNAIDKWVEDSTVRFLNEASNIISTIPIISARNKYETIFPNDYVTWKSLIFLDRLDKNPHIQKLVSIGDSNIEKNAAKQSVLICDSKVECKTIKFIEQPTIKLLKKQLIQLEKKLEEFIIDETIDDFFMQY